MRHYRMKETKQNSDELFSFLDFADVSDFNNTGKGVFVEFKPRIRDRKRKDKLRCLKSNQQTLIVTSGEVQIQQNPDAAPEEPQSPLIFEENNHLFEKLNSSATTGESREEEKVGVLHGIPSKRSFDESQPDLADDDLLYSSPKTKSDGVHRDYIQSFETTVKALKSSNECTQVCESKRKAKLAFKQAQRDNHKADQ